jgi:hypothetical protein
MVKKLLSIRNVASAYTFFGGERGSASDNRIIQLRLVVHHVNK